MLGGERISTSSRREDTTFSNALDTFSLPEKMKSRGESFSCSTAGGTSAPSYTNSAPPAFRRSNST